MKRFIPVVLICILASVAYSQPFPTKFDKMRADTLERKNGSGYPVGPYQRALDSLWRIEVNRLGTALKKLVQDSLWSIVTERIKDGTIKWEDLGVPLQRSVRDTIGGKYFKPPAFASGYVIKYNGSAFVLSPDLVGEGEGAVDTNNISRQGILDSLNLDAVSVNQDWTFEAGAAFHESPVVGNGTDGAGIVFRVPGTLHTITLIPNEHDGSATIYFPNATGTQTLAMQAWVQSLIDGVNGYYMLASGDSLVQGILQQQGDVAIVHQDEMSSEGGFRFKRGSDSADVGINADGKLSIGQDPIVTHSLLNPSPIALLSDTIDAQHTDSLMVIFEDTVAANVAYTLKNYESIVSSIVPLSAYIANASGNDIAASFGPSEDVVMMSGETGIVHPNEIAVFRFEIYRGRLYGQRVESWPWIGVVVPRDTTADPIYDLNASNVDHKSALLSGTRPDEAAQYVMIGVGERPISEIGSEDAAAVTSTSHMKQTVTLVLAGASVGARLNSPIDPTHTRITPHYSAYDSTGRTRKRFWLSSDGDSIYAFRGWTSSTQETTQVELSTDSSSLTTKLYAGDIGIGEDSIWIELNPDLSNVATSWADQPWVVVNTSSPDNPNWEAIIVDEDSLLLLNRGATSGNAATWTVQVNSYDSVATEGQVSSTNHFTEAKDTATFSSHDTLKTLYALTKSILQSSRNVDVAYPTIRPISLTKAELERPNNTSSLSWSVRRVTFTDGTIVPKLYFTVAGIETTIFYSAISPTNCSFEIAASVNLPNRKYGNAEWKLEDVGNGYFTIRRKKADAPARTVVQMVFWGGVNSVESGNDSLSWAAATKYTIPLSGLAVGQSWSYTLKELEPETQYWLTTRTTNGSSLESSLGNQITITTSSDEVETESNLAAVWAVLPEKILSNDLQSKHKLGIKNPIWSPANPDSIFIECGRNDYWAFWLVLEGGVAKVESVDVQIDSVINGSYKVKNYQFTNPYQLSRRRIWTSWVNPYDIQTNGGMRTPMSSWGGPPGYIETRPVFAEDGENPLRDTLSLFGPIPDMVIFKEAPRGFHSIVRTRPTEGDTIFWQGGSPRRVPKKWNEFAQIDGFQPANFPAGDYYGNVRITEGGTLTRTLVLKLTVRNVLVKDVVDNYYNFGPIGTADIARYHGKQSFSDSSWYYSQQAVLWGRTFGIDGYNVLGTTLGTDTDVPVPSTDTNRVFDYKESGFYTGAWFDSARGYVGPGMGDGNRIYVLLGDHGIITYTGSGDRNNYKKWFPVPQITNFSLNGLKNTGITQTDVTNFVTAWDDKFDELGIDNTTILYWYIDEVTGIGTIGNPDHGVCRVPDTVSASGPYYAYRGQYCDSIIAKWNYWTHLAGGSVLFNSWAGAQSGYLEGTPSVYTRRKQFVDFFMYTGKTHTALPSPTGNPPYSYWPVSYKRTPMSYFRGQGIQTGVYAPSARPAVGEFYAIDGVFGDWFAHQIISERDTINFYYHWAFDEVFKSGASWHDPLNKAQKLWHPTGTSGSNTTRGHGTYVFPGRSVISPTPNMGWSLGNFWSVRLYMWRHATQFRKVLQQYREAGRDWRAVVDPLCGLALDQVNQHSYPTWKDRHYWYYLAKKQMLHDLE